MKNKLEILHNGEPIGFMQLAECSDCSESDIVDVVFYDDVELELVDDDADEYIDDLLDDFNDLVYEEPCCVECAREMAGELIEIAEKIGDTIIDKSVRDFYRK